MNAQSEPERFRGVFRAAHPDVLRFVQRRTTPDRAEDVVADTFMVAWRRVADLPVDLDGARAWLFGIARNQLLNHRRGERRSDALAVRLADAAALHGDRTPDTADAVVARISVANAWHQLSEADQEVLALAVFEQLTSTHAAAVLNISPGAYRVRLSRARAQLRRHLGAEPTTLPLEEAHP
ncbi:RNA polymerase sigma factor [Propioniciclava soli]|uniref:RNA polymerase sigma factor n=1 Tax=Propioniciclava soli TaxID=2775081 RepID=UPI001E310B7A